MFGPKLGGWYVHSDSDPRWNKSGEGYGLVCTGGPDEMQQWIDECTKKYGEPPEDAVKGFTKY